MSAWDDDKPPRDWQVRALPVGLQALKAREPVVMHICTGAGKSYFTRAVVRSVLGWFKDTRKWRVIVLVPSQELVKQTAAALVGACTVDKFYAKSKRTGAQCIVVCSDSLQALADVAAIEGWRCGVMVVDEMHRSAADGVRAGIEALSPYARIGLTATPFRAGDEPIPGWSRVAFTYGIDEAIAGRVLVPFRTVRWTGSDGVDANTATLDLIRQHAPPGPGVVSATSIDDAEWYAGALTEAGIPAVAVHSREPKRTPEALAALERGDLRCVVHCDLLTEGVDLPWLRWLAMRRRRASPVAIVQEVGRVLRTHPGKREAVILDPHGTGVLGAIATDPNLGDPVEAARALRKAAENEAGGTETAPPEAVPAEDAEGIVAALVSRVTALGTPIPLDVEHPTASLTIKQLRMLEALTTTTPERRVCAASYIPSGLRDDLRRLVDAPDNLSRLGASLAIAALQMVAARARQERRNTLGRGGKWMGPRTWRVM